MTTPAPEQMRLLRNVAFAGAVAEVGEIIGIAGDVPALLATLVENGLVETDGLIAPTEQGLATLEQWYARDRAGLDAGTRDRLHHGFRPLDLRIKALARAWQEADARDDWEARMTAIEGLGALHADTLAYLARHGRELPRFTEYRERLSHALERLQDGETDYFVKVQVDSYHTIWFQMHEDLLRVLERERDPE
jgi:hypothetical protein